MAENGRQPPLPPQPPAAPAPAPADPSHEGGAGVQEVCRKFVWGTCNKHNNTCRYRHEHNYDEMISILKFCHNYQNKGECGLDRCSYLHTTNEEERLFKENGTLPPVLQKRYAAMAAAAGSRYPETMLMPPPPPPPPATAAPPLPPATAAPPLPPATAAPPLPPATAAPLPVPPPDTIIAAAAAAPVQTANSIHGSINHHVNHHTTYVNNVNHAYNARSPSNAPAIFEFDSSRPPPPFLGDNASLKRKAAEELQASRPPKMLKTASRFCKACIERMNRSAAMEKHIQQIIVDEADLSLAIRKKTEEFNYRMSVIFAVINKDHHEKLNEYIEGCEPDPNVVLARQVESILDLLAKRREIQPAVFRPEEVPTLPAYLIQGLAPRQHVPEAPAAATVRRMLASGPPQPLPPTELGALLARATQKDATLARPPSGSARGGYTEVAGPSAAVAVRPPSPPRYQYAYQEPGPSHAAPPSLGYSYQRPPPPPRYQYAYQEPGPSHAAPPSLGNSYQRPPPPPRYQYAYQEPGPSHAAPPSLGYNYQEAGPTSHAVTVAPVPVPPPSTAAYYQHAPATQAPPVSAPYSYHVPPQTTPQPYQHPPYAHPPMMGRRERQ